MAKTQATMKPVSPVGVLTLTYEDGSFCQWTDVSYEAGRQKVILNRIKVNQRRLLRGEPPIKPPALLIAFSCAGQTYFRQPAKRKRLTKRR